MCRTRTMDDVLTTERLFLRPFVEDDFDAVHAYGSDLEVVRYMPWGPNTPDDTRDFIHRSIAAAEAVPRRDHGYAVVLRDSDALIGGCGIHVKERDAECGSAELGYAYHRDAWGFGYATEAARRVAHFGFEELGLHRICAYCDVPNVASARVLEKIGMRREARLREAARRRDGWRDEYVYAVLRDDEEPS